MKPLDRLSEYLGALERRLRYLTLSRGAAVTAVAALGLTIVAVMVANQFAFSNPSVVGARVFLFLGLAFALGAALVVPVIRLNRRHAARKAENLYPQFEERLLTFTERVEQTPNDPFLHLLAADTLVYIGDLRRVFEAAHARLGAEGYFLFTVEKADGEGFELGPKRRWRHSEAYLRRLAEDAGFAIAGLVAAQPRREANVPVEGFAVALRR